MVAGLESEIRKLSGRHGAADQAQLASLKAELATIMKAKNDCQSYSRAKYHAVVRHAPYLMADLVPLVADVAAHPEHRKFVFPDKPSTDPSGSNQHQNQREPPGLYNRDGKLKHPERSAYYDPVFNPFGAPPPGMPYRERRKSTAVQCTFQPSFSRPAPWL